ncbi:MAG: response regulator transcription factor [Dehalococcoidia bacterium]|nr:response regulator transcription factor [Dehalococcoidia bacterium]
MATAKPMILVADDYPAMLRLISRVLEVEGYRVVTASDGDGVLKLVSENKPLALVVLGIDDVELPSTEICCRLRQLSDVPVIILSGRRKESDAVNALNAGADEYIRKPFTIEEFVARVKAVLRHNELATNLVESPRAAG